MVTGIVSAVGRIVEVEALGGGASFGRALTIETPPGWLGSTAIGDSIAIAGACMTVVTLASMRDCFRVEISAASLAATSGLDSVGDVNLEKALRAGDRLDGHLVSGHVDGVGEVLRFDPVGEGETCCHLLVIRAPQPLARYLARRGSITIDGVSLTTNSVDGATFSINLIPHTLTATTLNRLQPGSRVNLEVDLIARYVERMLNPDFPEAA